VVEISTLQRVSELVKQRSVRISAHGYARITKRGILFAEILSGLADGTVIEDYPDYHLGPAILVLQVDSSGRPLHAVWGIEKGTEAPAVIVTAYYPDASEWTPDFRNQKS
jgi:Domain of unknown function (DUF4258)